MGGITKKSTSDETASDIEVGGDDEKAGCATQGVKLISKSVHPGLEKLPSKTACCIASFVILVNIVFVVTLTMYNWSNVNVKLSVLDAAWTTTEDFNVYSEQFTSPTHLCNSYGLGPDGNGGTGYNVPCLLPGLTCENNYADPFCTDNIPFECSNDLPMCYELGLLASVISVEGDSFTVAFGSAQGYLLWVQLASLALCFSVYYGCCKCCSVSELRNEVQELAKSSFQQSK